MKAQEILHMLWNILDVMAWNPLMRLLDPMRPASLTAGNCLATAGHHATTSPCGGSTVQSPLIRVRSLSPAGGKRAESDHLPTPRASLVPSLLSTP